MDEDEERPWQALFDRLDGQMRRMSEASENPTAAQLQDILVGQDPTQSRPASGFLADILESPHARTWPYGEMIRGDKPALGTPPIRYVSIQDGGKLQGSLHNEEEESHNPIPIAMRQGAVDELLLAEEAPLSGDVQEVEFAQLLSAVAYRMGLHRGVINASQNGSDIRRIGRLDVRGESEGERMAGQRQAHARDAADSIQELEERILEKIRKIGGQAAVDFYEIQQIDTIQKTRRVMEKTMQHGGARTGV